jgi:hypothetical protein
MLSTVARRAPGRTAIIQRYRNENYCYSQYCNSKDVTSSIINRKSHCCYSGIGRASLEFLWGKDVDRDQTCPRPNCNHPTISQWKLRLQTILPYKRCSQLNNKQKVWLLLKWNRPSKSKGWDKDCYRKNEQKRTKTTDSEVQRLCTFNI